MLGRYCYNSIYGNGSTMHLRADHTFEFKWFEGLNAGTTLGTWERKTDKIILNSRMQSREEPHEFEIIQLERGEGDSLVIQLIDTEEETIPFANCMLMRDSLLAGQSTNLDGKAVLPRLDADSLIISYLGYKTIRCKYEPSVSSYVFKMQASNYYYQYFTDAVWEFKKGRLYDPSIKKTKHQKQNYYSRCE